VAFVVAAAEAAAPVAEVPPVAVLEAAAAVDDAQVAVDEPWVMLNWLLWVTCRRGRTQWMRRIRRACGKSAFDESKGVERLRRGCEVVDDLRNKHSRSVQR